ncbi:hypothetical protein L3X38_020695 [Prunus dulcis]|uniref:Uncharacterized protein n=1 Tax=Prunus dulcis TaxID=3755 RepID=A0AAD4ZDB2_PRUDU|nr:hypothetical protein L3X38_020695 [Prunus dulcis]
MVSADVIISGSSPGEFCPWACPVSWGPPVARAGLEALEADSGLLLPFAWASLKRWACSNGRRGDSNSDKRRLTSVCELI